MTKTNAERQAAYRNRRALTPKDEYDFRSALSEAYFAGLQDGRKGIDAQPLDTILPHMADELDSDSQHTVANLLRALQRT